MITMNFIDIQIEMLKEYKKVEKKGNKLPGLYQISDCGNLMITTDGFKAYVIPKDRILIDASLITKGTHSFKGILDDTGAELITMTQEIRECNCITSIRSYKAKKGTAKAFENVNGEKIYVNTKFLKPYENEYNITYKSIPDKHNYNPVFVYQDNEMVGMILPIRIEK